MSRPSATDIFYESFRYEKGPCDRYGLTLAQQMAYPILKWFFFGSRASGRSTLMAHVLIREAIEHNHPVQLVDHTEVDSHLNIRATGCHFVNLVERVFDRHYARNYNIHIDMRNGFRMTCWAAPTAHAWNKEWK